MDFVSFGDVSKIQRAIRSMIAYEGQHAVVVDGEDYSHYLVASVHHILGRSLFSCRSKTSIFLMRYALICPISGSMYEAIPQLPVVWMFCCDDGSEEERQHWNPPRDMNYCSL